MEKLYQAIMLQQEKVSSLEVERQNIEQELFAVKELTPINHNYTNTKKQRIYFENQIRSHCKSLVLSYSLYMILLFVPCLSETIVNVLLIIVFSISNSIVAFHYYKKRKTEKVISESKLNEEYTELKTLYDRITNELFLSKEQLEYLKRQVILDYMKRNSEKIEEFVEQEILVEQMRQYYNECVSSDCEKKSYVKKI